MDKLYIIGVGDDGPSSLGQKALEIVSAATLLCGGQRTLDRFPDVSARKIAIKSNPPELVEIIRERIGSERIAVLASGDPNFFGIARLLVGKLGKERVEIIPNVSSMQLAFARIKESWDDATLASVHARDVEEIVDLVRSSRKIGILTDEQRSPAEVARVLLARGLTDYTAHVCENLGSEDERIVETDLAGLASLSASPLNVLILTKKQELEPEERLASRRQSLGIPDDEFHHRQPLRGLITKAEVRVVSISKMNLCEDSVVWDVGAGSGSVSVEAALIARRGQVYAVERNPTDAALVRSNVRRFDVGNVYVVEGLAPEALSSLPDPNAVFVGGSGGRMEGILDAVRSRLKAGGSVVANFATISNLNAAVQGLGARGFDVDVALVNVARSKGVADLLRFEALDPVFVASARRSEER